MRDTAPWSEQRAAEVIAAHVHLDGAALPILHALQEAFGFVPPGAIPMVAEALNVSRADMHGVVSFYHDFRAAPPGRHVLKLCRAEACQAMGGAALAARVQAKLGVGWGETSADGAVTVEPVYCLGLCACAPAALWDGQPVGRLDEARLDALLAGGGP
jgi:formate dehydrogenase subunit gamma